MAGLSRLRAGDRRTRIEILQRIKVSNGKGGYSTAWSVFSSPWAEVLGQDGREAVIGQALQGISTYRIRIRWRSGVSSDMQIRLGGPGGTDLNIKSAVDPTGRREQLMIIASTESAEKTS
jgi:SPP1 family predicted phage head-tail adaptor